MTTRPEVTGARRIVVKVGSSSLTTAAGGIDPARVRRLVEVLGAVEGDTVLIGHPDDAVVFDFKPGMDAGAENLARRGEDHRFDESRPAARRRREIQEGLEGRAEGETRADVARRLRQADRPSFGPQSYEIGSSDDPDWAEADPGQEPRS